MPRFVILLHETPAGSARSTHHDLMFEQGDVLRTWAVEEAPFVGCDLVADVLADHRLEYLDYEGPISNDRGEVRRMDHGNYHLMEDCTDRFVVQISGRKLQGKLILLRDRNGWRLQLGL